MCFLYDLLLVIVGVTLAFVRPRYQSFSAVLPLSPTPLYIFQAFPQEAVAFLGLIPLLALSASARASRDSAFLLLFGCALTAAFLPGYEYHSAHLSSGLGASEAKRVLCVVFSLFLLLDYSCFRSSKDALVLLSLAFIGSLLMLSSSDWFLFFLSAEALSLSSCCLIGLGRSRRSLEAALKYFAAGALASCFLLLGVVVVFIACGQVSFSTFPAWYPAALSCPILICAFFMLKSGCAPFHYWVADVYEGSPPAVTVFLAVVSKLAFFMAMARALSGPLLLASPF